VVSSVPLVRSSVERGAARRLGRSAVFGTSPRQAIVLGAVSLLVTVIFQLSAATPAQRLIVAVVVVVTLGAGGLCLRGAGEIKDDSGLKANGYFLGAAAYIVTASVTLINGLRLLG
jgi:hypothetical protein